MISDWKFMSNRTSVVFILTILISFLSITTVGCSDFTSSGISIMHGSENLTVTPSYTELGSQTVTPPYTEPSPQMSFQSFYVSLTGKNTNGRSWNTAWNELDQIQWDEVSPGDTVVIAGGEYHTQLKPTKSGTSELPITITTNGEQVILDGQLPVPPYCGQTDFVPAAGDDGINLEGRSFIVIDGQDWRGIVIRHHIRGIRLRRDTNDITVRNVEIYANGYSRPWDSGVAPDGPGVELSGRNVLFERVIIHDNGQDAIQAGVGVWNFTLRDSWLYNSREHPVDRGLVFNHCAHTDGIQIYKDGVQGPILLENSIIGPSFTQGLMLNSPAIVNDVVIRNSLFVGRENAGIDIQSNSLSSNWTLQNVTIVQIVDRGWNLKMMDGENHKIKNSLFYGGSWGIGIFDWTEASGNYNWQTPDRHNVATEMDPMFLDDDYSSVEGDDFATFDFTIQNPAIPSGTGTSITSVMQLFDR